MAEVPRPMFRRVDHIGVIVDNLAEARRWMEVFGLPLRQSVDIPQGRIHGEFYGGGNLDIELIEIGDPEVRRKRLGEGNRTRIEHVAVDVDDLGAALARLAGLGVTTTTPAPRQVGDTLNIWTDEATTGGISYQLIQRGDKRGQAKTVKTLLEFYEYTYDTWPQTSFHTARVCDRISTRLTFDPPLPPGTPATIELEEFGGAQAELGSTSNPHLTKFNQPTAADGSLTFGFHFLSGPAGTGSVRITVSVPGQTIDPVQVTIIA